MKSTNARPREQRSSCPASHATASAYRSSRGSGVGMAIAANKVRGIRAAPIVDVEGAVLARQHNDLNVLTLGARRTSVADAERIVAAFLDTPFAGGRHQQRVTKIGQLDDRNTPATAS